jgi:formylglycine-generating enzyme required for sulfatase activity/uncharacterized caspase-like protein
MLFSSFRIQIMSLLFAGSLSAGLFGISRAAPEGTAKPSAPSNNSKPALVKPTAKPAVKPTAKSMAKPTATPVAAIKSPEIDSTTALDALPSGMKRALIIGVEKYETLTELNQCGNDARAFATLLQAQYGFKANSILLVTDDDESATTTTRPTYLKLKNLVKNWVDSIRPGDEVIFFFSGHGANVDGTDRLLPNDVAVGEISEYSINYKELRNDLENKKPRHCVMITDACRNIIRGAKSGGDDNKYGMIEDSAYPQFAEMRSCMPSQTSLEMQDKPFGAFTYYLLKGLRDDPGAVDTVKGAVTFDSLTGYLRESVASYALKCNMPTQTPTGSASQGSMVFRRVKADQLDAPLNDETLSLDPKPELKDNVQLVVRNAPAGARLFLGNEEHDDLAQPLLLDIAAPERIVMATIEARGHKRLKTPVSFKRGFATTWNVQMEPDAIVTVPNERTTPDGATMVWVPYGLFWLGSEDKVGQEDERPMRKVEIPKGYWIDKTEVTVAQYRAFCKANNDLMPPAPSWGWRDDDPMVNVTYDEAVAYAKWAKKRLPTEAEWEKAARGDQALAYPWGNQFSSEKAVVRVTGIRRSSPSYVGSIPEGASPYGALDMSGNVAEWCSDWYMNNYYRYCETKPDSDKINFGRLIGKALRNKKGKALGFAYNDPQGPERLQEVGDTKVVECTQRVMRGGFWATEQGDARAATRYAATPKSRLTSVGFRCVSDDRGPPGSDPPAKEKGKKKDKDDD